MPHIICVRVLLLSLFLVSHLGDVICRIRAGGSLYVLFVDSAESKLADLSDRCGELKRAVCIESGALIECKIINALES